MIVKHKNIVDAQHFENGCLRWNGCADKAGATGKNARCAPLALVSRSECCSVAMVTGSKYVSLALARMFFLGLPFLPTIHTNISLTLNGEASSL